MRSAACSIYTILAAVILSAAVHAQEETILGPSPQEQITSLKFLIVRTRQQLQENRHQIALIRQKASQTDPVREARLQYEEILHRRMLEKAPHLEEEIKRRVTLAAEVHQAADTDGSDPEQENPDARLAEYNDLEQRLLLAEQQALGDKEVAAARMAYDESLATQMPEADQRAQVILLRELQLRTDHEKLQARLQALQQLVEIQQQMPEPELPEPQ